MEVPVFSLPETYHIEMTADDQGKYSRTHEYKAISCPEGIYLYSSVSKSEYVFEKQENGRYIQYQKSRGSADYTTPGISEPLWEQINAGNVSLDSVSCDETIISGISSVFMNELNSYEALRSALVYEGSEEIGGRLCYKYHAVINRLSGETEETYWIEPETGVCMKRIEDYRSSLYPNKRTVTVTVYETENCILPEH